MTGLVIDSTGNRTTYRLIGIAMRVHNRLGPGYKEEVYERAFAVELLAENIAFKRQHQVVIQYDGVPVALFILDL
jgi:GxxExxY protein